jgi:hypothetical protein
LFLDSKVFIKHFSDNDFSSFEEEAELFFEQAVESGLLPEEESLKTLIELGHWSENKEQKLLDLTGSIRDAEASVLELRPHEQDRKKGMKNFISSLKNQQFAIQKEKSELIGTTAESFSQRKNNERIILHSLFKDEALTETFFTEDQFDELGQDSLIEAISLYNKNMEFFTETWIKRIAVMPSFLNAFFLCNDDPRMFFGKPIIELTIYQTDLFSKGKYFKSILNESEADGPDQEIYDKGMQAIVNWYDQQYSIIKGKRDQEAAKARQQARTNNTGASRRRR